MAKQYGEAAGQQYIPKFFSRPVFVYSYELSRLPELTTGEEKPGLAALPFNYGWTGCAEAGGNGGREGGREGGRMGGGGLGRLGWTIVRHNGERGRRLVLCAALGIRDTPARLPPACPHFLAAIIHTYADRRGALAPGPLQTLPSSPLSRWAGLGWAGRAAPQRPRAHSRPLASAALSGGQRSAAQQSERASAATSPLAPGPHQSHAPPPNPLPACPLTPQGTQPTQRAGERASEHNHLCPRRQRCEPPASSRVRIPARRTDRHSTLDTCFLPPALPSPPLPSPPLPPSPSPSPRQLSRIPSLPTSLPGLESRGPCPPSRQEYSWCSWQPKRPAKPVKRLLYSTSRFRRVTSAISPRV
ncbi:hypothetical protein BDZ91DRAFT_830858 [Kalaharituber pfeilii]|nr:hypothetical protein BDZ91DRAFT_830858 [Kalaharituber pfeilii]